jgi:peptidoglycan/LPS O-acetylase OafA/YrhL
MFKGIEGARGWLAWTVVFTHIVQFSGLAALAPRATLLTYAGDDAVLVFIIISGFVITNLLLMKNEPYGVYIVRRGLRIFPAYFICLLLAIAIAPLSYEALGHYIFTIPVQKRHLIDQAVQYREHLLPHLLTHVTLFQGAIPNSVMTESEYMFLPPAWSLSLEWQFYLIAPIWLFLIRKLPVPTVLLSLLAVLLYNHYFAWRFYSPSFLPGAALWFLIGIGTRIAVGSLRNLPRYPWPYVLGFAGLLLLSPALIPLVIWVGLVAYFMQEQQWALFDSGLARALGARSYSVYILHLPVLFASAYAALVLWRLSPWAAVAVIAVCTLVGTLVGSEILHRAVEVPFINIAKRLGRPKVSAIMEQGAW